MNSLLNSKKELVVLEIANNHQGDLEHGKNIISEFSNITKKIQTILIFPLNSNTEI